KARSGDLRRALEVDDAQRGPDVPVRAGFEVEGPRLAPRAHDRVVGRAPALRHARVRKVGQHVEHAPATPLDAVELVLELADLLAALPARLVQVPHLETLPPGAGHLVAGGVLLALEPFDFGNQAAALGFEGRKLFELGGRVEAAGKQPVANRVDVVTDESGIKHGWSELF